MNTRLLREVTEVLLGEYFKVADFDVAICIVRAPEMARLNETFLRHEGSTDVITFDYLEGSSQSLHGEIFICIDEAVIQARRFRAPLANELTRYVIHGLLHLRGFDDTRTAARRKMKREENRLLKNIARLFRLRELAAGSKLTA